MFEVEKNVPITSERNSYPFDKMDVGDSFSAPESMRKKLHAAAGAYGRANGLKFSVRKAGTDIVRVWRVS